MSWRLAALVLIGATACGGGGDGADDDVSAPTTRPPDQVVAERVNLQIDDFPPEWKSTPVPPETLDAAEAQAIAVADCLNRPRPEEIRVASAYSDDFSAADTRRASSSVAIVRTEEIADADYDALRTDLGMNCIKASVDREFDRQLPGIAPTTTIQRVDMPQFGDDSVAYRVNATTTSADREIRTVIDLAYVRKGRVEMSAGFINRSAAFPLDLQRTLLQRMVGRA